MAKLLKVAGIFFAGLMVWMLVMILLPSGEDKTPTIYHHPDGTFSLNRKDGKSVTPEEIYRYFRGYSQLGRIRLVAGPSTRLGDWLEVVNNTAAAGVAHYQLEGANGSYNFTIPGSGNWPTSNAFYQLINLSKTEDADLYSDWDTDTVIWVDASTRCDEIIDAALPLVRDGKSVLVTGRGWYFHHDRDDDSRKRGPFIRRPSKFWEKYVQPQLDRFSEAPIEIVEPP